jgi:hypothetical protein
MYFIPLAVSDHYIFSTQLTLSMDFRKGANSVQDLKAQMKAEADRVRIERYKAAEKAAKERAERQKAEAAAKAVAPSAASKRSPSQVTAEASNPYDSSAPVSTYMSRFLFLVGT